MKEIGEELKSAREEHGVSVEEAAEDLNLRVSQIENIEAGNLKVFKDVFYLKCFIRDYAKYLGLDEEKIMDEFNEFFFEETSKIPIAEIEKASKEKQREQKARFCLILIESCQVKIFLELTFATNVLLCKTERRKTAAFENIQPIYQPVI